MQLNCSGSVDLFTMVVLLTLIENFTIQSRYIIFCVCIEPTFCPCNTERVEIYKGMSMSDLNELARVRLNLQVPMTVLI